MPVDRRTLLIAGATAAVAARVGEAQTEEAPKMALPSFDGSLRVDEMSRATAADDFGHMIRNSPEGVLLPGSDQDVATAIRWAREQGRKVAARGQGHSVYGRAQVRDGLVIDMRPLRQVHAIADDRVVVGAGATWREVLAATLPRKLTPPVLTGYLDLSVGGTLVVGGVGDTTFRNGMQSDNVVEMDVVTGSGRQITCSAASHPDLFDAMRAGLGKVGIITRATIRLMPAPDAVRLYELAYPDLQSMLTDQRRLATEHRFQALQGAIVPSPAGWTHKIDAISYTAAGDATGHERALLAGLAVDRSAVRVSTQPYLSYLDRLAALERLLRSNGQWSNPHPWLTTFVGDSVVERLVADELSRLPPADLGPFGQVLLSPLRSSAITSPLLRLPAEEIIYAFNLVRMPTTSDKSESDRLTAANRAVYDRVRAAGGFLYPVSALAMSGEDWRSHFGPTWTRLRQSKWDFDPEHILTPGYEIS